MSDKNKVNVRIAGRDYTLVGIESEEYIQRVALYIDKKLNTIMKQNSKLSTSMASVLTAVNVADDYFKSRESIDTLSEELNNLREEAQKLKDENTSLSNENAVLENKNTNYQLQLAKREAELNEVRNALKREKRE
ncbi:cell division protein ZapA [Herbivorax sp. ANBcel31]|uniref:cell division protein ZapA n=1 Tax=Herbivorax sp. ANBcel31 TaxID=3069754 RepID=UPI0027B268B4|nr:cell division protein ZapA [Herbivorax sp. ANBcel31]MDQ2086352.1 cell division protein ZapA [Herbivorax sp. ANBcel31]